MPTSSAAWRNDPPRASSRSFHPQRHRMGGGREPDRPAETAVKMVRAHRRDGRDLGECDEAVAVLPQIRADASDNLGIQASGEFPRCVAAEVVDGDVQGEVSDHRLGVGFGYRAPPERSHPERHTRSPDHLVASNLPKAFQVIPPAVGERGNLVEYLCAGVDLKTLRRFVELQPRQRA